MARAAELKEDICSFMAELPMGRERARSNSFPDQFARDVQEYRIPFSTHGSLQAGQVYPTVCI